MPWTDPATWTVGELVLASKMNTHVRDNLNSTLHSLVRKTADESVTSNIVVQDDDQLLLAMAANEVWFVRFILLVVDASALAANFRCTFTTPTGAVQSLMTVAGRVGGITTGEVLYFNASATERQIQSVGAGVVFPVDVVGTVVNGGTAGNLLLRWAQVASNASAVTVKANSMLLGMKLA